MALAHFIAVSLILVLMIFEGNCDENFVSEESATFKSSHIVKRAVNGSLNKECRVTRETKKNFKESVVTCMKMGKFPLKKECRVFVYCSKNGAEPRLLCCPPGLSFDHKVKQCVEHDEARCMHSEAVCVVEGTKFSDPYNPWGYLQCTDKGIPEEFHCPENHRYVVHSKACEKIEADVEETKELSPEMSNQLRADYTFPVEDDPDTSSGNSSGGNGDATKSKNSTGKPSKKQKRKECKSAHKGSHVRINCTKAGSFPLADECHIFRKCFEPGKLSVITCCPPDLKFDHKLRRCVDQVEATCVDVCLKKGNRYPDPYNPYGYLECSENLVTEEFQCPGKHRYASSNSTCVPFERDVVGIPELDAETIARILDGYELPDMEVQATTPSSA